MKYIKVWTDFKKVLKPLNADEVGRLFLAMLHYAETGEEPEDFQGNEVFLWAVAKRDIDIMAEKAETLRQNGSKGGRPKAGETKENQTEPNETKENQSETNESRKEKKINEKKGNDKEKTDIKEPQKRFIPPTVEEVAAYMKEIGCTVDPQYFVDYHIARNWVLSNGKQMKDWRATVRTWAHNNFSRTPQAVPKTVSAQAYAQRDYSGEQEAALHRMMKGAG